METTTVMQEGTTTAAVAKVLSHKDLDFGQIVFYISKGLNSYSMGTGKIEQLTAENAVCNGFRIPYSSIYTDKQECLIQLNSLLTKL